METLQKIYYDAASGFIGRDKLYRKAKAIDSSITHKLVKEFLSKQETSQIHKQTSKQPSKSIVGPVGQYQSDVMFMDDYRSENDMVRAIVSFIEINTKKVYAYPLKAKTKISMGSVFRQFISDVRTDGHKLFAIQTDSGKEYVNDTISKICTDEGIDHRISNIKTHLSIVERFNRTLRGLIQKWMTANNSVRWISVLKELISNYNSTHHSSIDAEPNDVDEAKEEQLMLDKYDEVMTAPKPDIQVGNIVRVKLNTSRSRFAKEGFQWSKQLYRVDSVGMGTVRVRKMELDGTGGRLSPKSYRFEEIQVTPNVEKIGADTEIVQAKKKAKVKRAMRKEGLV